MAAELVGGKGFLPFGEKSERFRPDFGRQRGISDDIEEAAGVLFGADAVGVVNQAAEHQGRPLPFRDIIEKCGSQRPHVGHVEVGDRTHRLVLNLGIGVIDETCDFHAIEAAQRDHGGEAKGRRFVGGQDADLLGSPGDMLQRIDPRVTQEQVAVVVFPDEIDDRGIMSDRLHLSDRDARRKAYAGGFIGKQGSERKRVPGKGSVGDGAQGLDADLGIGVIQENRDGFGRLLANAFFRQCRTLNIGRRDGAPAGDNAESPDAMNAFDLIFRLRSLLEDRDGITLPCQRDLSAQTHARVGVGEKLGEFGGFALVEAFGDKLLGFLRLTGEIHLLAGVEGEQAAVVMGLPAVDEVGYEHAAIEGILYIRGSHTPHELAGVGHFHTGTIGFHLERPDAGVRGTALVVADEEAAFLAFQETDARMIGQTGRAGAEIR